MDRLRSFPRGVPELLVDALEATYVLLHTIDLDVERNVLTVKAEGVAKNGDWQMLANERVRGSFSRQLVLGDNLDLDLDKIEAAYDAGVLRLVVPVAEKAKPRKIEIAGSPKQEPAAIES